MLALIQVLYFLELLSQVSSLSPSLGRVFDSAPGPLAIGNRVLWFRHFSAWLPCPPGDHDKKLLSLQLPKWDETRHVLTCCLDYTNWEGFRKGSTKPITPPSRVIAPSCFDLVSNKERFLSAAHPGCLSLPCTRPTDYSLPSDCFDQGFVTKCHRSRGVNIMVFTSEAA